jgi:hypothetical protein
MDQAEEIFKDGRGTFHDDPDRTIRYIHDLAMDSHPAGTFGNVLPVSHALNFSPGHRGDPFHTMIWQIPVQ